MKNIRALSLFWLALASSAGATPAACGILMNGDSSLAAFRTTCKAEALTCDCGAQPPLSPPQPFQIDLTDTIGIVIHE
jgi:hypothetical protein